MNLEPWKTLEVSQVSWEGGVKRSIPRWRRVGEVKTDLIVTSIHIDV